MAGAPAGYGPMDEDLNEVARSASSFVHYALIGGVATSIHYASLLALVQWIGFPAAHSAALAALCGALVAYLGNRVFTFSSRAGHRHALPRFLFVAALAAGLNGLIVWGGTRGLNWHYLMAQVLASIVVLGLTYRINRAWTFA